MAGPEVSVVIPVRDGAASLPPLLESLAAQDLPRDRFEVIVVDNASRDATAEIAAAAGARVVSEPRPNRSGARNAGVAAARAAVIAFTDADCVATPGWLAALMACRGRAPLLAGPVEIETGRPPNAIESFEACWRFDQAAGVAQGWAATANLLVEREAFEAIGGFDTAYRHIAEDVDFCLRAGACGLRLELCQAAVVRHGAETRLGPALRRAFFHGYSAAQAHRRLGVGEVAWRHPGPLVSPRAARARHNVRADHLSRTQLAGQSALAVATYASRVAGSLWASATRAG